MVCDDTNNKPPAVAAGLTIDTSPLEDSEEERSGSSWEEVRKVVVAADASTSHTGMTTTTTSPKPDDGVGVDVEARLDGGASVGGSPLMVQSPGSTGSGAGPSLAERQRLQRQAQLTFLRTQGLIQSEDEVRGGAGAASPVARDGIVSPRRAVEGGSSPSPLNSFLVVDRSPGGSIAAAAAAAASTAASSESAAGAASPEQKADGKQAQAAKKKRDLLSLPSLERVAGSCSAAASAASSAVSSRRGSASSISGSPKKKTSASASSSPSKSGKKRWDYAIYPEVTSTLGFQTTKNNGGADDTMASAIAAARKAGVAVAGGALVAAGAVLMPLPTPGGILLVGAGMGALSTEFEGAKKVMDKSREKLVEIIDKNADSDDDDEEEGKGKGKEEGRKEKGKNEEEGSNEIWEAEQGGDAKERDGATTDQDDGSSSDAGASRGAASSAVAASPPAPPPPQPSQSTSSELDELKSALKSQARKLGKSIRPLLTDEGIDDLQRKSQAKVDEVRSSTHRALGRMRSHLNDIVDTFAVPDAEFGAEGLPGWTNPGSSLQQETTTGAGGGGGAASTTTKTAAATSASADGVCEATGRLRQPSEAQTKNGQEGEKGVNTTER